ncbi:MAG: acetoacetate decarboxylase family protein [Deltaproteobacteria bacterium]|nr:acetoacetate decarboxylase family protein [Candidatus Zymogenaceae bacterium]
MRRTFKKFHGISAVIDPTDRKLYRGLLPDVFDMPDEPLISLSIVEYVHIAAWPLLMSYREGAVALRSRFKDDEGWFILDMPVTRGLAAMARRHIGFPKKRVDSIEFMPVSGIWRGGVATNGRDMFAVELSPDGDYPRFEHDRPACKNPAPPMEVLHLVRPPRVGSTPVRAWFQVKNITKETPTLPGTARVSVNPGKDWAPLIDETRLWPGVYFQFWGGASISHRLLN